LICTVEDAAIGVAQMIDSKPYSAQVPYNTRPCGRLGISLRRPART
jgi:hypothetical protein